MAALVSDCCNVLHFFLLNCLTKFNETRQETRSQQPLLNLCFSDQWEKKDGHYIASDLMDIFTSSLQMLNGIKRNLTEAGSQLSVPSLCFSGYSENKDCHPGLLLLCNRLTEFNETRQEVRSECPLPRLCFWAHSKTKMTALASDWLIYF